MKCRMLSLGLFWSFLGLFFDFSNLLPTYVHNIYEVLVDNKNITSDKLVPRVSLFFWNLSQVVI